MRLSFATSLLFLTTLTGCLSTVRVKRDPLDPTALADKSKETNVQGIPFYVKVAKCKQETIWIEPVYTLTLKRTFKTKFVDEEAAKREADRLKEPERLKLEAPQTMNSVQIISLSNYQNTPEVRELQSLLSTAAKSRPDPSAVEQKWETIAKLPLDLPPIRDEDSLSSTNKDVLMVENIATAESLVDYSRVYYYNSPRPWVGSSQVDVKLASDGTMTEGSTQVQSQTLSTFISALPISSVLTGVAKTGGIAIATTKDPFAKTTEVEYELVIQQEIYKHTHTAYASQFSLPCTVTNGGVTKNYALQVDAPGSPEKKDDTNTVKITGSVVLPKQPASTDKK